MKINKVSVILISLISSITFAQVSVEDILSQANNMSSANKQVTINQSDMSRVLTKTNNQYSEIREFVNNGIRQASSRSYSSSISSSQVQCYTKCGETYDENKICKGLDQGTFSYAFSKHADCSSRVYRAKSDCELECYQKYH